MEDGSKFFFTYNIQEVLFIFFDATLQRAAHNATRWYGKNVFKTEHLENIKKLLRADTQSDRNIGVALLEQTLDVVINGKVIGDTHI